MREKWLNPMEDGVEQITSSGMSLQSVTLLENSYFSLRGRSWLCFDRAMFGKRLANSS